MAATRLKAKMRRLMVLSFEWLKANSLEHFQSPRIHSVFRVGIGLWISIFALQIL